MTKVTPVQNAVIGGIITEETDKAIKMQADFAYKTKTRRFNVWIPKSLMKVVQEAEESFVEVPSWFANRLSEEIRVAYKYSLVNYQVSK